MSEDELLRELGQVAREEAGIEPQALDERWDRLAAGTASAEEDAELRRLAETSEQARAAYEAFRPLGDDFHGRVVAAIAAQAAGGPTAPSPAEPRVKLLPFRRHAGRLAAWGAATTAAAAAMAMLLIRAPPLPAYAVADLAGGSRTTRGELVETPELAPGDRFQATLRPQTAVPRAASLRAEGLLLRGAELRRVDLQTERDASGAMRVTGTLDRDLPAGTWTLWLVVGRRGALPDPAELRSFAAAAPVRHRDWMAMPATLQIRHPAPG